MDSEGLCASRMTLQKQGTAGKYICQNKYDHKFIYNMALMDFRLKDGLL